MFFSLKKEGNLSYSATWFKLKDIRLSEVSQPQKTNTVCIYLNEVLKAVRFLETEGKWWLPGSIGREEGGVVV